MKDLNYNASAAEKPSDAKVSYAFRKGNILTKLSLIIFGLGNLLNKQIVRGLAFLVAEIAYIYYMATFGINALVNMTTLGTHTQEKVYNAIMRAVPPQNGQGRSSSVMGETPPSISLVSVACTNGESARM